MREHGSARRHLIKVDQTARSGHGAQRNTDAEANLLALLHDLFTIHHHPLCVVSAGSPSTQEPHDFYDISLNILYSTR